MLSQAVDANVVIVAPDEDLHRSLAFMFEAEGCSVRTVPVWPIEESYSISDIVVIDESALPKGFQNDGALAAIGARLILLGIRPEQCARLPEATIVSKPLLDRELIDAVRQLIRKLGTNT